MAPRYWFSAKRYGWGWGLPASWQGWVVLIGYLVAIFSATIVLRSGGEVLRLALVICGLTVALVLICWLKGEPSRWRWGGD
jgi:hypothetical protein